MDGTLVGSDAAVARSWAAWAREYGVAGADLVRVAHGVPGDGAGAATAALRGLDGDLRPADLTGLTALPGLADAVRPGGS
nr:hypothetical protein [Pseudonocardia sp. AL041005-10]